MIKFKIDKKHTNNFSNKDEASNNTIRYLDDDRLLCLVSEKGKIIVNKCINKGYSINTQKLEKLLVIAHGMMMSKYERNLFNEDVVFTICGPMIMEVDRDFIQYGIEFNGIFKENILLLEKEDEIIEEVIDKFGMLDALELNELEVLSSLNSFYNENSNVNIIPTPIIKGTFDYYLDKKGLSIRKKFK